MSLVAKRQAEVIREFETLTDWEDRYKRIIDMGRRLPDMTEDLKTEDNKVKGCQSQVWLHAELDKQGHMHIHGDSDAMIVKGLVALVLRIYSDAEPADILQSPPEFLRALGFEGNLSPSRANGLHSMLKQIRLYATAFAYVLKSKSST